MTNISLSVIITTYNRPKALSVVLESLSNQSTMPLEIIIADDGSKKNTKETIEYWQQKISCPLLHVWQKDQGFRAAAARNKAVRLSSGNYLVFLDGDCVVFPDFIKNHISLAEPRKMVMGSRILCSEKLTTQIENLQDDPSKWVISDWISARLSKKINRIFPLIRLGDSFLRTLRGKKWRGIRTFNLALWRKDFIAVNGFDERFQGWGHEDADLAIRLIRYGILRKDGQFSIPVLHLWHKENDRTKLKSNEQLIDDLLNSANTKALIGIDSH
mgnify:FL=1